ncbi:MAG TPA: sensor histidine kinase, partial [Bacillota bacterium]|nr:sensor histidine kinase [Bacillota bacterium]
NVAMRADYCQRIHETKADSKAEVADELNEIKKLVQDCLIEMRQIIFNLRPMSLDDLGLISALQRFTSTVQKNTSALINVTVLGKEVRLSGPIEIALFRLAQESINNAIKHSSCSQIDVKVEFADQEIVLVVKDDGLGFDVEEKKSLSSENHHFGLVGMEERIRLLGGKFGIESVLGEGTRVWCRVAYDTPGGEFKENEISSFS